MRKCSRTFLINFNYLKRTNFMSMCYSTVQIFPGNKDYLTNQVLQRLNFAIY